MGRPDPMRPNSGNCCSSESIAERIRATWMMAVFCSSVKPHMAAMMSAGVMTPANDASTCCNEHGMRSLMGGMPARSNNVAERPFAVVLGVSMFLEPSFSSLPCKT